MKRRATALLLVAATATFAVGVATAVIRSERPEAPSPTKQSSDAIVAVSARNEYCDDRTGRWAPDWFCTAGGAWDTARTEGIGPAMQIIEDMAEASGGTVDSCHDATHLLGREAYMATGDLLQAHEVGLTICEFGFYHGLFEQFGEDGTMEDLQEEAPRLCDQTPASNRALMSRCAHGVGHAAMFANEGMENAFDICTAFRNPTDQTDCIGGVIMVWFLEPDIGSGPEYIDGVRVTDGHAGNRLLEGTRNLDSRLYQDTLGFCERLPSRYADACYPGIAPMLFAQSGGSEEILQVCATYPAKWVDTCAEIVGGRILAYSAEDPVVAIDYCNKGDTEILRGECYRGVAVAYTSRRSHDEGARNPAEEVCALVEERWRSACLKP